MGCSRIQKRYPRNPGLKTTLQGKFKTHIKRADCVVKTVPVEKPTPKGSHKVSGCHKKGASTLDSARTEEGQKLHCQLISDCVALFLKVMDRVTCLIYSGEKWKYRLYTQ